MTTITDPKVVSNHELETWSRCADSYLQTFSGLTGEALPLLIEAAQIGPGQRLLDIGSGPGNLTARLATSGAEISAVDFSGPMIDVARREYPGINFQQADAEQLPFPDGSFDAVVSNLTVHHLARPAAVFGEVARVLRPGGRFTFTVWGAPEEQTSFGVFFAAVVTHHDAGELPNGPLFGVTDAEVYTSMLAGTRLADLTLETRPIEWAVPTLEPVLTGLWAWGNVGALPRDLQDKIERSTRDNAETYKQADGYRFPHSVQVGVATRH